MSEHELATLLREAEPPRHHAPDDIDRFWLDGRRRVRRSRRAWVAGAAAAVLLVAGVSVATNRADRDHPVPLDVAGPTPDPDASVAPVPPPGTEPSTPPGTSSGPSGPMAAGLPAELRIDRATFRAGDGGLAEVGLVRNDDGAAGGITVAIPLTLEAVDPSVFPWVYDLYDMSGVDEVGPYWQPHDTGVAWYERTSIDHGFPVRLPVDELAEGSYGLCLRGWPTAEDPAWPDDAGPVSYPILADGSPPRSSTLAVPGWAQRLCIQVEVLAPEATGP